MRERRNQCENSRRPTHQEERPVSGRALLVIVKTRASGGNWHCPPATHSVRDRRRPALPSSIHSTPLFPPPLFNVARFAICLAHRSALGPHASDRKTAKTSITPCDFIRPCVCMGQRAPTGIITAYNLCNNHETHPRQHTQNRAQATRKRK
jgi:hypothetical protein